KVAAERERAGSGEAARRRGASAGTLRTSFSQIKERRERSHGYVESALKMWRPPVTRSAARFFGPRTRLDRIRLATDEDLFARAAQWAGWFACTRFSDASSRRRASTA